MERYSVAAALHRDGEAPLLLMPFQRTATISAFANEIKNRITRYNFCESGNDIFLRLRREDGPILDDNDILADVIHNPRTENIVVTSRRSDLRAVDPGSHLASLAIAFNLLLRRADLVL
jgi:urease accessory protein UreE